MIDYGASGREDSYSFHLVDPFSLEETGEASPDAASSSVTFGYYTDNYSQASLTLAGSDYREGGMDRLVRVKQQIKIGEHVEEVTHGTFFVDNVGTSSKFGDVKRRLTCYSTLWRFTKDYLVYDFNRKKGYNVVRAIREIVEADGGKLRVMEGVDASKGFAEPAFFELGENKATAIRTMAGTIGCQIGVDGDGYITIEPYLAPRDKAPVYTFEAGRNCTYLPGIEWSTNRGEPINRVKAYFSRESKQDDDDFPLTDSVLVDLPESSEFSYEKCGRRRTYVMKLSEPCSHADLMAKARTYLLENSGDTLYIEIEHVGVPTIEAGDTVRYINEIDHGTTVDCIALVAEQRISKLVPGCKTKSKLKIVGWN